MATVVKRRLVELYRSARFECKAFILSRISLSRVFLNKQKYYGRKIEIGAGIHSQKSDFLTIDLSIKADIPYDLKFGLPLETNSLETIYSEHVLENFNHRDLIFLLKEYYRSLRDGGIFSCVVPDAKLYVKAYCEGRLNSIKNSSKSLTSLSYQNRIDILNHVFYMDGHHQHMFYDDSMVDTLTSLGFKQVCVREFNEKLDRKDRKYESIYFKCIK
jgi:predicted SAM-dependent methyltransferase